jgi:hypothetical protein
MPRRLCEAQVSQEKLCVVSDPWYVCVELRKMSEAVETLGVFSERKAFDSEHWLLGNVEPCL